MRVLVQRVHSASCTIDGQVTGAIDEGLLLLAGVTHDDTEPEAKLLAGKALNLRIFNDPEGKMNLSVTDIQGGLLSISQFTLYGDCRKGRRPSFIKAAPPEQGDRLYQFFNTSLMESGLRVATGKFGAMMDIQLINNGPVTIMLDSEDFMKPRSS